MKVCKLGDSAPPADDTAPASTAPADDAASSAAPSAVDTQSADSSWTVAQPAPEQFPRMMAWIILFSLNISPKNYTYP